jgi:hypothetical protein
MRLAGVMREVLPDAGSWSEASSASGRRGSCCRCVMQYGSGARWSGCRQSGSGWRFVGCGYRGSGGALAASGGSQEGGALECPRWRSGGKYMGLWGRGQARSALGGGGLAGGESGFARQGSGGRCFRMQEAGVRREVPQHASDLGLVGGASACLAGVRQEVLLDAGSGSQVSSASGRQGSGCRCIMRRGSGGRWAACGGWQAGGA